MSKPSRREASPIADRITSDRRMILRAIIACALLLSAQCGPAEQAPEPQASDEAVWAVDPNEAGPDEPPAGHSLFDELFSKAVDGERAYDLPFPFEEVTTRIAGVVSTERDANLRQVLIPIGRSLQRSSNRPNYFASPRVVVAVDGEAPPTGEPRPYLKDRLYLGYQAKVGIIEVISYNEQAARFEFQIVGDYQPGREPQVRYADRDECIACHQGLSPIFPRPLWNETSANEDVRALLAKHASEFFGVPVEQGVDIPQLIDQATDRANFFAAHQLVWSQACPDALCRADALFAALAYRLGGYRHTNGPELERFTTALTDSWVKNWPDGLKIPNPDIPDRDIIGNLKREIRYRGRPEFIQKAGSAEFASFVEGTFTDAVFEPRTPRPPLEVWKSSDINADFARNVIAGLSGFFSEGDLLQIRATLGGDDKRLRAKIEEMSRSNSDALSDKPLRHTTVVAELTGGPSR